MKVLIVDPDEKRIPALQQALVAGGAAVSVAPSGLFALTMLEWHRQDVILSRARIGDMEGHELCAMVKSDPSTRDVRFVLVGRPDEVTPSQTATTGVDLVIPPDMSGSMIVTLIVQLMLRDRTGATPASAAPSRPLPVAPIAPVALVAPGIVPVPVPAAASPMSVPAAAPARPVAASAQPAAIVTAPPSAPPPALAPKPAPAIAASAPPPAAKPVAAPAPRRGETHDFAALAGTGAKTFQGSLGVMEMEELTQVIAVGGKTGRLLLVLNAGGGMIAFDSGRIVHAEFGDLAGETAFEALVATSHQERSGKFCFIPGDTLGNIPRTIARTVDQLLLSIATTMDERGR